MKTKIFIYSFIALLLMSMTALTSCKKKESVQPEKTFDINHPEGYFIYAKVSNNDGTNNRMSLIEFLPEQKFKEYYKGNELLGSYNIIADNTIEFEGSGIQLIFDGNAVSSNKDFKELALIKAPESNQLAGKTFAGAYYKPDKSILHPNFFYQFHENELKEDAGYTVGTIERTENYQLIGNIAALANLDNGDNEFMVLVNGKLEVNYWVADGNFIQYGTFTKQ